MLSPLRLLVALLVAGWLARGWLPHWLRALAIVFGCVLVLLTTPLGANALVRMQESRAPAAVSCEAPQPQTIVLLSGGVDAHPQNADDYAALDGATLRRLFAALELYRAHPQANMLVVGTSGSAVADSLILANLARRLGVADTALRVETRSLTTWENAAATAQLVPAVPRRIWLVTSALHMPRALDAFRRHGFEPCAWPAQTQYHAFDGWGYFLPVGSAAIKAEQALHEIVGEVVYRLRADPVEVWHARAVE